ncbi:tyrosine-type recombinase/integrase [Alteromonas sp. ASW11-130]|uniref:tyrosine-type recombinase/integrase n=1 Tax=Alteromonas sp. ASW11-130 TaxID=3015775 RepID=UPI0022427A47|nr:site-specific integrase [Alteromonas sp. ASW11-130]MCW8091023.1 site-specific integrase [Alteromonas sp. ASW11-130]
MRSEDSCGSWNEALLLYVDSRQTNKTIHEKKKKLEWWSLHLADKSLTEINSKLILTTLANKTGISLATKNRYIAKIKSFLNFIHKELEWIERVPHIKTFKEREKNFYKLTEKDSARLIDNAPPFLQPIIIFALATGFRASNITGLKWNQVNLNQRMIKVDADSHKSGSAFLVPMNSLVHELLTSLHKTRISKNVFTNESGQPNNDLNRRIWARAIKAAELEGLRFHDRRHIWASRHAESGTDLLAIKELGGWKTLEMVQRYTHPSLNYLSQQANNIVKNDLEDFVTELSCDNQWYKNTKRQGPKMEKSDNFQQVIRFK